MSKSVLIVKKTKKKKNYQLSIVNYQFKSVTFAVDLKNREVAQLVSVHVWGACGRQFESGLPDQSSKRLIRLLLFCVLRFTLP